MTAKTPVYTRNAVKRYDAKVIKKQVVLNPDSDAALIAAIAADDSAFSVRVKLLLKEFYGVLQ